MLPTQSSLLMSAYEDFSASDWLRPRHQPCLVFLMKAGIKVPHTTSDKMDWEIATMGFSRRSLMKATAGSAVLGGLGAPWVARAQQAEFSYKFANNLPDTHPLNIRAREMAAAIKTETNGKFDMKIFPNN